MKTKKWIVDIDVNKNESYPQIIEATKLLQEKEVIAFPTETVYGLGADATSSEAVSKIFQSKGRPSDNPLIVHISSESQLNQIVSNVPESAKKLMDTFWPGPLTIVLPKRKGLSDNVTAGLDTVGVRMPNHPVALALITEANLPIAAPSANSSGKPSPTTAKHVLDDLDGKIAGIIDGGATGVGVESTVIDCSGEVPTILRPGGITREQIEEVLGVIGMDPSLKNDKVAPKSPGMKYTHYAPNAPLVIVEGSIAFIQQLVTERRNSGNKVGVLATEESMDKYDAEVVLACGQRVDMSTVAQKLYDVLREFNDYPLDIIYSESFAEDGIGNAVMNRLTKASGNQFMKEV